MKTSAILVIGLMALPLAAQIPPLPDGQIIVGVSPSTGISIGQTVTVTCRMSGYHGSAEIDSVNFTVRYDASLLAFVNGSFNMGTASGQDQQWLSKAPQESAADGYGLTNRSHGIVPGYVCIMLGDLGLTAR